MGCVSSCLSYIPVFMIMRCRTLQWRHNGRESVSNHQPHDCLLNRLFRRGTKKTSKLASLAFVWGIHRWPVNSPHKWPITRKMFPFDDVIMRFVAIIIWICDYNQWNVFTGLLLILMAVLPNYCWIWDIRGYINRRFTWMQLFINYLNSVVVKLISLDIMLH